MTERKHLLSVVIYWEATHLDNSNTARPLTYLKVPLSKSPNAQMLRAPVLPHCPLSLNNSAGLTNTQQRLHLPLCGMNTVCFYVPLPAGAPRHSGFLSVEEEQCPSAPHLHIAPPATNSRCLLWIQRETSHIFHVIYFLDSLTPLTSCRRSLLLCACCSVVTVSFGGRPRRPRLPTRPTVTCRSDKNSRNRRQF